MSGAWMSPIDALVEKHRWTGGYLCSCGREINSPQTWSRHVAEDAWEKFTRIGAQASRSEALCADLRASGVESVPGVGQDDESVSVARDGDGDE